MYYRLADARINSSTNCSRSCKNDEKSSGVENENCGATQRKLDDISSFGILAL